MRTVADWIVARHGEDGFARMLTSLPEEQQRQAKNLNSIRWYSAQIDSAMLRGIASTFGPDASEAREATFRELGRHVAEENVNAVYRFFFNLAKPATVVKILPKMWTKYFKPVQVDVQQLDLEAGSAVMHVEGVAVDWLAPVAEGWVEYVYEMVGAKSAQVRERGFAAGNHKASPLIFDVSWDG